MRRPVLSHRRLGGAMAAAFLLAACGGQVTAPEFQARPPIRSPLAETAFTVPSGGVVRLDFDVDRVASVFGSVDWGDPGTNLVATITDRDCPSVNDALAGRCARSGLVGSPSVCPSKPRQFSFGVYQPLSLRLWIANTGPAPESGRASLVLCTDAPDCAQTLSCAQCLVEASRWNSCR